MDLPKTITHQDFALARRNLIGGSAVVLVHSPGWLDDKWVRAIQLRIESGNYKAKLLTTGKWIEIDQLRVRCH